MGKFKGKIKGLVSNFLDKRRGGSIEDSATNYGGIIDNEPLPDTTGFIDKINNTLGKIELPTVRTENNITPNTLNPILMLGGAILLIFMIKKKK